MSDFTVSGSLPNDDATPQNTLKPKATRQGRVSINAEIKKAINELGVENQKQVEKIVKEILDELYQQQMMEYEFNLASIREVLGNFGVKSKSISAFRTNLMRKTNSSDASSIPSFDEMYEYARKYAANILPPNATGDDEQALVDAIVNYPQRPKKSELIGDAVAKALYDGAIQEDTFDYSVFQGDLPTDNDVAEFLANLPRKPSIVDIDADYNKWEKQRAAASDAYRWVHGGGGNKPPETPPTTAEMPEPDDSGKSVSREALEDLLENEFFTAEDVQELVSGRGVGGRSGGKSLNDMQFSAMESMASQLISRTFGTSFYPILTALRTTRNATQAETGEEVGIGDVINFTAGSTNKMFSGILDMLGLSGIEGIIRTVTGIDAPGTWANGMPPSSQGSSNETPAERLNGAAAELHEASQSLNNSGSSLEDLLDNDTFGNGGSGGGGGGNGFTDTDPEDPSDRNDLTDLEKIAGIAGLFFAGKIAYDIIGRAVGKLFDTAAQQTEYAKQFAYSSISSPESVSGVEMFGQPLKAGAGVFNAAAGVAGGLAGIHAGRAIAGATVGLATRFGGTAIGQSIGGAIGTTIPIPVVGTIVGAVVGGMVGNLVENTVGGIIDVLQSIDEGIQSLSTNLAPYSAELMSATVEADIRRLEGQIRQAEVLGPDLADYTRSRSQFEDAVRGVGTELALLFTPIMTGIYDIMTTVAEEIKLMLASMNVLVRFAQDAAELITLNDWDFGPTFESIKHLLDVIANNTEKDPKLLQELEDFINPDKNRQGLNPALIGNVGPFGGFPVK